MTEKETFDLIKAETGFAIEPCETTVDLEDARRFTRLQLNDGQKMQVSSLLHQLPQAVTAGSLANAYSVSFPKGLPHTLTALHQGGYGSMVRVNGEFAGSASFYPMAVQAAALGAFTAMSAVTGQYFLTKINGELKIVNHKLDEIIEFLYGDKRAELMAEINFVKYAHANYSTIMMHEQQRLATITSLQAARKLAMRDIEFYLNDLDSTTKKTMDNYADLCKQGVKAFQIKDSIEMSRQLYVVSGLLELYYAQNFDQGYLDYVGDEMKVFIGKCDSRILSGLSTLQGKFSSYKPRIAEKVDESDRKKKIEMIEKTLTSYTDGNDSPIRVALRGSLEAINKKADYYLDAAGNVYMKK